MPTKPTSDDSSGQRRHGRLLRWLVPALVVLAWVGIAGVAGPYAGKLGDVQTNNGSAFLPSSAESTEVAALQKEFRDQETIPAVIVLQRDGGVTSADSSAATALAKDLGQRGDQLTGPVVGPVPSKDGEALEIVVPLASSLGNSLGDVVTSIQTQTSDAAPPGLATYVTGPAGYTAELTEAFAGIDGVLLLVAVLVVLVILIIVYRSPILPFVVLFSSLFALSVASLVIYLLADSGTLTLNGQSQGILFILVVGAATDYALLLTARYREELRRHEGPVEAMLVAWRRSVVPIVASGGTVIVALLCLLASDLNSTRSLGPVAAIGIACALLSALTFLPAALVLLGRRAFWPVRPTLGSETPETSGLWGRISGFVTHRPRAIWIGTGVVLVVLAAFLPTLDAQGTSQSDQFLHQNQAVTGQKVAAEHFPGGAGSPAVIIGPADQVDALVKVAASADGVSSAAAVGEKGQPVKDTSQAKTVDGLVEVDAVLTDPADSEAAIDAVRGLRTDVHRAVPSAKVGGTTATDLDTQTTAERDRDVIIPLVLAVILVLLGLLLRAIVAPLILLVSVVLSFAATLGVSALVFNHLFHFPGADPSVPLYGFVFLVALGIDYNIFLMSRVREESIKHGTHEGVRIGLASTGGVITSAGIVLAATFSALTVIPLLFLAQIAFIVGFGVLLDTLVVRTLLVPAVTYDLGDRVWWPGTLRP